MILRFSAILLPLSIGFTVVVITLLLLGNFVVPRFILCGISLVSGSFLWYAGSLLNNRLRFFFASTFLLFTGVLLLIIDLNPTFLPLPVIWPLLMLFIAISFIVSGFFHYRRALAMFIVPAVAFSCLGFIFLLFSTKVIPISLTSVALWWFPLFFLPSLTAFIIWLFHQKHTDKSTHE
jgi:hypothetical protein